MRNVTKPSAIPTVLTDSDAQKHFDNILKNKKVTETDCKIYRKVKEQLLTSYNNKCCYCESELSGAEIEHYRPKSDYYWLVYSWDNLMPICSHCNKNKGSNFKISSKTKTKIAGIKDVLTAQGNIDAYNAIEKPKLLNPEKDKIKENTFIFDDEGKIKSNQPKNKRISFTIDLLKLNRSELLAQRKKLFDDLIEKMNSIETDTLVINLENEKKRILIELVKNAYNLKNSHIALRNFLIEYYKKVI